MKEKMIPAIVFTDTIILPGAILNVDINNSNILKSCEEAMATDELVFVVAHRKDSKADETDLEKRLCGIGVLTRIRQINKLPNKHIQLLIEGVKRARMTGIYPKGNGELDVTVAQIENGDFEADRYELEAMLRNIKELFTEYLASYPNISRNMLKTVLDNESIGEVLDTIAGSIPLKQQFKQELLETTSVRKRFERLSVILADEIAISALRKDISDKVKNKIAKGQREYALREQMNVIRKELGDDEESEAADYEKQLEKLIASDEVKARIRREISRFRGMGNSGAEALVERNYIETLLEMPWDNESVDCNDLGNARKKLDEDHFGLREVKDRVLEFLAVRSLTDGSEAPIMCLVGPPGTGKTSIARSIAEALNKKYVRISLGGVHDEAEIRGHRRTYVGSMPGRIATGLKNAKVKNPLMLLDEIDKVSSDYKGDCASALLEVLDSEQNNAFNDHYIELPIDLSKVLFIATANSTSTIPRPLLDRMEIIEVSSYTANEKFHIAKEHLLSKQYKKNGLSTQKISINDAAVRKIIDGYTREAGVRQLERKIAEVCRKAAIEILEGNTAKVKVTSTNLKDYLGTEKYRRETLGKKNEIGVVNGLAWTSVGGDTLTIEVNIMPGKGNIELTGKLGDVMKESAMAGISYIRSISSNESIDAKFFSEHDIHIHVPEGAVPKDGPSAGITMATAVYSAIKKIPVKRDVAMTGEITLRGRVLPIGGLKEKVLAAKMKGITKVLVPEDNIYDVKEISPEILENIEIVYVSTMNEVLAEALEVR